MGLLEGRELKPGEGEFRFNCNYIRCSIFGSNLLSVKVAVAIPHTCLCGRGMEITEQETRSHSRLCADFISISQLPSHIS